MKQAIKKIKKKLTPWLVGGSALLLALVITACTAAISIFSEDSITNAGDSTRSVLNVAFNAVYNNQSNQHLVIGICVPKEWNATVNAKLTIDASSAGGTTSDAMEIIPASNIANNSGGLSWSAAFLNKFGIGPNLIDDMEWVVYRTVKGYDVLNANNYPGKVYVSIKTSDDNMQVKLGYGICEEQDGFATLDGSTYYASVFGNCRQIINGTSDLIDFCNPQIGVVDPSNSTKNDIITFKYDGNVDSSALADASPVYLCATAYLDNNRIVNICSQEDKAAMLNWGFKKWRKDIWPAKYFGLTESENIVRIDYFFTDKTGTVKTGYNNTADPFRYTFKCKL